MRQIRPASLLLAALLLAGGTSPALAALCAGTAAAPALCPPGTGDCVVSTTCSVPSGLVNLGARKLVVASAVSLTVEPPGQLTVTANGIEFQNGGKILALGGGTQWVRLTSTSPTVGITMASAARIDTSDKLDGGEITLDSAGPVTMNGLLESGGASGLDSGGFVSILAQGEVRVAGEGIVVDGGNEAFGGDVDIATANGAPIVVSGPLNLQGGDGGAIAIAAEGNVDVSSSVLDVNAILAGGYAGEVDVSGLDVSMATSIVGTGREDNEVGEAAGTGGDGAAVAITAAGRAFINAINFDIQGAPSGVGGDFEVDAAGDLTVNGKVLARASGKYGSGSEFVLLSSQDGDVTVGARIDAAGGQFGGAIDIFTNKQGGKVTITGAAQLIVDALGGLPADQRVGGVVSLDACAVEIAAGAVLSAKGPSGTFASNVLRARTSMIVGGTLDAGTENRLEYRDTAAIITLAPLAKLTPAATIARQPLLSCCGAACAIPTTTTTTLRSVTTTTTPPVTTTTFPPTTSTTLPSTTTTTLLPTTTTSTTSTSSTTSTTPPTSTTSTTTTTTSSTAVTSTTVAVTTTTTVEPSTTSTAPTTTAPPPAATTTTTLPTVPSCSDEPTQYDAATCEITRLTQQLDGATMDQLGGKQTANRLRAFIRRAVRLLDTAAGGKDVDGNLRRAVRQLKGFERTVAQGAKRKRRPIDPEVAASMLSLSTAAKSGIGLLQ